MINWKFYINSIEVDQPMGFGDLVLNIKRDEQWHGIFFEASISVLTFFGAGAALLISQKQSYGLAAAATFRAEAECGETIDVLTGNFDFGTYTEKCGIECGVEIAIEKSGCVMALRNRYEQKVDMQKLTAFDNGTLLQNYTGLDIELELTAQKISIGNEAETDNQTFVEVISDNINWTDSDGFNNYIGWIAPALPKVTNSSFGTFNASPIIDLAGPLAGVPNRPPYPDFATATGTATLAGSIVCELTDTTLQFRMKGSADVTFSGSGAVSMTAKVFILPSGLDGTIAINWVQYYAVLLFARTTDGTSTFDLSATVPLTVNQGDFVYFGFSTRGDSLNNISNFTLTEDPETFFKLMTSETCDDSTADASLVNEFGSRIVESITGGCLQMKSDYYGRINSEPYASDANGCGSLRMLTNGLKLRNATTSNHFISLQEFYNGLRGIDNIGMGIEDNPFITDGEWLRVEPVEYFYRDLKILSCPGIPEATSKQEPTMAVSSLKIGYQKWEVETVNGLNEFNSNKEFRTSLKTINNILDATSNFVAGGIPIEVTRQQTFVTSGSADTKYDDDTFIICVADAGYSYVVEKNIITSPLNIFSPATCYNWRIRPFYNLMRWFKSVAQSYVNLANTDSLLYFTSGTGNYIAEGRITTPDPCDLENKVLAENDNLSKNDFVGLGAVPMYKPETVQFSYPLSIANYVAIKANPYGYVEYQCGNGNFEKGFIKSIDYKPVKGEAVFTLIKKWL